MSDEKKGKDLVHLVDLFMRPVDSKRLPKDAFDSLEARERDKREIEEKLLRYEDEQAELHRPLFISWLEQQGFDLKEHKKSFEKMTRAAAELRKSLGKDYWRSMSAAAVPMELPDRPPSPAECKEITVRICQRRVCVDQDMAIPVNDIFTAAGFDGTFQRIGTDGFSASDAVAGSSTWNWTYHRHSQTHDGEIVILAAAELLEDSRVHGAGILFRVLYQGGQPLDNSGWAHGNDPWGVPPSTGHVKGFYRFEVRCQRPGQGWTNIYSGGTVTYLDHGPVASNIAATPNFFQSSIYSDPQGWSRDLSIGLNESFPAGTLFMIEVRMSYWIKGLGLEGEANIYYGMHLFPYLRVEACSYEYPDVVTINTRDYL